MDRHPLRERLREQLMLSLYRSGRQADALEVYQDARRALTDGLGIEPGRELRELQQAILRQDTTLDASSPRLAPDSETLAGRTNELAELLPLVETALARRGAFVLIGGRAGDRQEQAGRDARRTTPGGTAPGSFPGAAGRPEEPRPTGPGFRRCARTRERAIPRP